MIKQDFGGEQEVYNHWKTTGIESIIFDGVVYSVKGFKKEHPGGVKLIEMYLGKDIKEVFEEEGHSASALKLLKTLPVVGQIVSNKAK